MYVLFLKCFIKYDLSSSVRALVKPNDLEYIIIFWSTFIYMFTVQVKLILICLLAKIVIDSNRSGYRGKTPEHSIITNKNIEIHDNNKDIVSLNSYNGKTLLGLQYKKIKMAPIQRTFHIQKDNFPLVFIMYSGYCNPQPRFKHSNLQMHSL